MVLVIHNARAGDDWLCKSQSSERRGNSILSCGIGTAPDEATARIRAFNSAKDEFIQVCSASDDCKGREIIAKPQRTECELGFEGYKCYRLVVFEAKAVDDDSPGLNSNTSITSLIKLIGHPTSVAEIVDYLDGTVTKQLFYSGAPCAHLTCNVLVKNNKIVKFNDFKSSFVGF